MHVEDIDDEEFVIETLDLGEHSVSIRNVPGQQFWDLMYMGVHIWPGARLLCDYMRSRPELFAPCSKLCELGSGTGIAGLVFARLYGRADSTVVVTDSSSHALKLMEKNVALNHLDSVHVNYLRWGEHSQIDKLPCTSYDCILAADCTFSVELVPKFLETVEHLLPSESGRLVMCAVMGGAGAFEATLEQAPSYGLHLVEPREPPTDPTTTAARSVVLRFERCEALGAAASQRGTSAVASGG